MDTIEEVRRRALRGGFVYLGVRIILQVFQWVITLLVARLLLPEDYGLMTVAALTTDLAVLIAAAGFGSALVQRKTVTPEIEGQAFVLNLLLAGALYACIWSAAPSIAAHLGKDEFAIFVRVVALGLLLAPLNMICGAILERELKLASMAAILAMSGVAQTLLVLGLAFGGFGVWALGAGSLLGHILHTAASWWLSRWRPRFAWPGAEVVELAHFGVTVALTNLMWFAYTNADKAAVASLLGSTGLGLYGMAYQLITLPADKLTFSVNRVAYATYCRLQSELDQLRAWYLRLVSMLFAITAPALVGAALIADDAIPLALGEKWRGLVAPFQVMAPAGALIAVAATLPPLLVALGRPDIPFRYGIVCTIVYPIAFLLAALQFGLIGVCFVWLTLYPLQAAGLIHAARHTTGISLVDYLARLVPTLQALVAMTVAVLLVRWGAAQSIALHRVAYSISTGVAVYAGALTVLIGPKAVLGFAKLLRAVMKGRDR